MQRAGARRASGSLGLQRRPVALITTSLGLCPARRVAPPQRSPRYASSARLASGANPRRDLVISATGLRCRSACVARMFGLTSMRSSAPTVYPRYDAQRFLRCDMSAPAPGLSQPIDVANTREIQRTETEL